ncbi:MAG: HAMP domain-containing histidine kinase [Planctomycetes bacterium]|nr:HAMP domain-containing histidine kinase [Planctomycetota bacterium]
MTSHQNLYLGTMACSIGESLGAGIVSFDCDLKIIDHTPLIEKIFELQPTINRTLSAGTDANIWGNWKQLLCDAIQSGSEADFGIVKYTKAGTSRLLQIRCVPIKDLQAERLLGGAAVIMDVTEKLETDHEMAQTERLMAIGKVAGKVAHELNNPLDGILRYVNLTLRILEQNQPEKAKEYLLHCRSGLGRMAQIITEMLEFSRSTNLVFETNPIDKLLDDAVRAMESSLRNIHVEFVRSYTGPVPHMKSDSLFQVFCNLIKNASDAMDGRGDLTISLNQTEQNWQIEFCDTGHGFDAERVDDLFKPFYTTKPRGRGTGLGLGICKDILEKLHATILARNNPQGGASFIVQLPMISSTQTGIEHDKAKNTDR